MHKPTRSNTKQSKEVKKGPKPTENTSKSIRTAFNIHSSLQNLSGREGRHAAHPPGCENESVVFNGDWHRQSSDQRAEATRRRLKPPAVSLEERDAGRRQSCKGGRVFKTTLHTSVRQQSGRGPGGPLAPH